MPKDHFLPTHIQTTNPEYASIPHDLATVMEGNIMESGHFTILGDLNIKINDTHDRDPMLLLEFMDSFDLLNKVTFPTPMQ